MQVGGVGMLLNHPVVAIGSTAELYPDLKLARSTPVAASAEHVLVAARAQTGLVLVRIWTGVGPMLGDIAFDGNVHLSDGRCVVKSLDELSQYSTLIGEPGPCRATIMVDDPGSASRIDVIFGSSGAEISLTFAEGYPLPVMLGADSGQLDEFDELDLILSSHDRPLNRLAAVVKMIISSQVLLKSVQNRKGDAHCMRMIAQWARWLAPHISLSNSLDLSNWMVEELLSAKQGSVDRTSVNIASDFLHRMSAPPGATSS